MSEKQPVFATDWVARARPTAINVVLKEVRKLEAEGKKLVSLMRGQPDTPTPIHIIEAANQAFAPAGPGIRTFRANRDFAGPWPRSSPGSESPL